MKEKGEMMLKDSTVCLPYTAQACRFWNAAHRKTVRLIASQIYAKDVLQKKGWVEVIRKGLLIYVKNCQMPLHLMSPINAVLE